MIFTKEENKSIGSFICRASLITIKLFEFTTDKTGISKYLERDRSGLIDQIIISIFCMIFAVPIFIFMKTIRK